VYEQWNNANDKEYSRNLGTGDGIELVKIFSTNVPMAPRNLHHEMETDTSATLTWDLNENLTSHYVIEQSIGNPDQFEQIAVVDSSVNSYEVTGAYSSELYYYRIMARNPSTHSSYSQTIEVTMAIPLAPTNLVGEVLGGSEVRLTWEAASEVDEFYVIEQAYRFPSSLVPIDTLIADSTAYTVTGLQASSYYFYRIKALNLNFESDYTETVTVFTGPSGLSHDPAGGQGKLEIYPNPLLDFCKVRLENSYLGPVRVAVINLNGSTVQEIGIRKDRELLEWQLDVSELATGSYVVELSYGSYRSVKKVFKAK
jgi:hypothetical protein